MENIKKENQDNKKENDLIKNEKRKIIVINNDNSEQINADFSFKLIVIGNSSVGKSSLVDRAIKNRFLEDYSATIGFDYYSFFLKIDDQIVKLQIWDTCGQEIYQSLISNFYRNSSCAIMVYAINDKKSFENLEIWLKELRKESNPDVKTILIGNKCDLESKREVSFEEAEKYSKDFNFVQFFETSAKTGFNAQKVFISAAILLYDHYLKCQKDLEYTNTNKDDKSISNLSKLSKKLSKTPQKGGCC